MASFNPLSKEIFIEIPPSKPFKPAFIEGMDREFGGRGPFVTVLVILRTIGNRKLGYQIFMNALETTGDWTFFQGKSEIQPFFDIEITYPGYRIATILSDAASGVRLLDNDQHPNRVKPNYGELVKEFIIEGDQQGEDQPWVQVFFNKVHLKIIESPHAFHQRIRDQRM